MLVQDECDGDTLARIDALIAADAVNAAWEVLMKHQKHLLLPFLQSTGSLTTMPVLFALLRVAAVAFVYVCVHTMRPVQCDSP